MSATVYGTARYGMEDDTTATGLYLANLSADYQTDQVEVPNHLGNTVGFSIYNDRAEFSCDGVVESKTTGFVTNLATVVTLANSTADTLDLLAQNMFTTQDANDGLVLMGMNLTRTNTGFETGSMSMMYRPLVATNSPSTVTD